MSARNDSFEVERRQATVMFCDLVEFTPLSARLDPEDLRDVLQVFRDAVRAAVHEQGGFIASYMGDGVLVLFGYPRTYEDAAARAVHAGLNIVAMVCNLEVPDVTLHVRVGISTGDVVVGNLVDVEKSRDEPVVGQVANLAARLQAAAKADSVLISESTYRLVANSFELAALGDQLLKGFDRPLPIWRVLGARRETAWPVASSTADAAQGLLAGRENELNALKERWQRACDGVAQVALVLGDPGIGKTSLCAALHHYLRSTPHSFVRFRCSERLRYRPLSSIMAHIEDRAGFDAVDSVERRFEKLTLLAPGADPEAARGVAELFGRTWDETARARVDTPELQRERLLGQLSALISNMFSDAPTLILIEDLQWADSLTLELVKRLVAQLQTRRVLFLATARVGFSPSWSAPAEHSLTLRLERLGTHAARQVIQHWAFRTSLSEAVIAQILESGDGIPLFIEELTKAVVEAGERPTLEVPSSLKDSLVARLDRLGEGKRVAHVAAAIGRDVSLAILSEVMGMSESELLPLVQKLLDAELLLMRSGTERRYTFKHAIIQDTAYSMLLRSTRIQLHRRIAQTIEAQSSEPSATEPETLAHHWREAGEAARAIGYYERAGVRAAAHAAHSEAGRHFSDALELSAKLTEAEQRAGTELRLLVQLGLSVSAYQGYAAPDVQSLYTRALEVSRDLVDRTHLFSVIRGLATYYIVRAELDTAMELSEQCLHIAQETQYPGDEIEGFTALGYAQVYRGGLRVGQASLTRAVALYRKHDGASLTYPSVQDPCVASLCLLAIVAALRADEPVALRYRDEALAHAAALGHPFNRAYAHCFAAMLANLCKDYSAALEHAAVAVELSQRHGFGVWLLAASLHAAMAEGMLGAPLEAAAKIEACLGMWRGGGARLQVSYFLLGLAECYTAGGRPDSAKLAIDQALEHAQTFSEKLFEAELLRTRAEHAHVIDSELSWRSEMREAIEVARLQGARRSELRAVRSWLERIDLAQDPDALLLRDSATRLTAALTEPSLRVDETTVTVDPTNVS